MRDRQYLSLNNSSAESGDHRQHNGGQIVSRRPVFSLHSASISMLTPAKTCSYHPFSTNEKAQNMTHKRLCLDSGQTESYVVTKIWYASRLSGKANRSSWDYPANVNTQLLDTCILGILITSLLQETAICNFLPFNFQYTKGPYRFWQILKLDDCTNQAEKICYFTVGSHRRGHTVKQVSRTIQCCYRLNGRRILHELDVFCDVEVIVSCRDTECLPRMVFDQFRLQPL